MDSYSKLVPVKFVVDSESVDKAEMQIDSMIKDIKITVDDFDKSAFNMPKTKTEETVLSNTVDDLGFDEIFLQQFEAYKKIKALKKETSSEAKKQLKVEQDTYDALQKQLKALGVDGQLDLLSKKSKLTSEIARYSALDTKEAKEKVKQLKEQLSFLGKAHDVEAKGIKSDAAKRSVSSNLRSIDNMLTGGNLSTGIGTLMTFKTSLIAGLVATGAMFIKSLKDIVKKGEQAAEDLYNASKLSNSDTRETMFHWGVDKASAQGINQANDIFGFNSDEDMFYGFAENSEVQKKYFTTMTSFAEKYKELQENGTFDKMLDYQIEMAKLDFDIQQEQAKFYMDNIDEIKAIKQFTLNIQLGLTKAFGWLGKMFNNDYTKSDTAKATEVLKESSTVNDNSKATHVSIDNSFNNQGVTDRASLESTLTSLLNVVEAALN